MEMVERVARNIELHSRDWPYEWDALPLHVRETRRDQARAAIEAMREPTEAMLIDGAAKIRNFTSVNGPYPRTRAVWLSMIDASLANRLVLPDSSPGPQGDGQS